jgi:hypothetical protein
MLDDNSFESLSLRGVWERGERSEIKVLSMLFFEIF